MKKNDKYIIFFVVFITIGFVLICANTNPRSLADDSGFDSSWDSGGSSWGSSDWGSSDWGSSSWDSDWSSSSSSSDFSLLELSDHPDLLISSFIVMVVMIVVLKYITESIFYKQNEKERKEAGLPDNENAINNILKDMPDFDIEKFKEKVISSFIELQESWMNFDYEKIKTLVTDELYNTYKSQLKTLKLKHQINKMHDFDPVDCAIYSYHKDIEKYTIVVALKIIFFDYLVNEDGALIRGDRNNRLIMTYNLTYVKSIKQKANKCPNCNSPLENNNTNRCPYCNSVIISSSHDWLLSKKLSTNQERE